MDWALVYQRLWDMKYPFRDASGAADADLDATWWRVARALAASERDPELWAGRFHEALQGFKFLPAGRVIAGAGTGRTVTLFNCFVMGAIPDDMSGIFENLREPARRGSHSAAGRRHRARFLALASARRAGDGRRRRRLGPALLHGCVGLD